MSLLEQLENEIKALNDVFYDHHDRFLPQALKVIEARAERAAYFKTVLKDNLLKGWSGIHLNGPIQCYIIEIENIYKLQALFPRKENLDKIKTSCETLRNLHHELTNIPAAAHDEDSLAHTQAFLTQVTSALEWGDGFFKQTEIINEARSQLIAKTVSYQSLKAQEEAKSLTNRSFFFANLFYNPAYAA